MGSSQLASENIDKSKNSTTQIHYLTYERYCDDHDEEGQHVLLLIHSDDGDSEPAVLPCLCLTMAILTLSD